MTRRKFPGWGYAIIVSVVALAVLAGGVYLVVTHKRGGDGHDKPVPTSNPAPPVPQPNPTGKPSRYSYKAPDFTLIETLTYPHYIEDVTAFGVDHTQEVVVSYGYDTLQSKQVLMFHRILVGTSPPEYLLESSDPIGDKSTYQPPQILVTSDDSTASTGTVVLCVGSQRDRDDKAPPVDGQQVVYVYTWSNFFKLHLQYQLRTNADNGGQPNDFGRWLQLDTRSSLVYVSTTYSDDTTKNGFIEAFSLADGSYVTTIATQNVQRDPSTWGDRFLVQGDHALVRYNNSLQIINFEDKTELWTLVQDNLNIGHANRGLAWSTSSLQFMVSVASPVSGSTTSVVRLFRRPDLQDFGKDAWVQVDSIDLDNINDVIMTPGGQQVYLMSEDGTNFTILNVDVLSYKFIPADKQIIPVAGTYARLMVNVLDTGFLMAGNMPAGNKTPDNPGPHIYRMNEMVDYVSS